MSANHYVTIVGVPTAGNSGGWAPAVEAVLAVWKKDEVLTPESPEVQWFVDAGESLPDPWDFDKFVESLDLVGPILARVNLGNANHGLKIPDGHPGLKVWSGQGGMEIGLEVDPVFYGPTSVVRFTTSY